MCGICGTYGFEDSPLLKRMMNIIQHRGPDDSGSFIDKNIMLGQRRLSIIDLSKKGKQPLFNEDQSLALIVNGEIYNYKKIKKELERKGHKFYSNTDVEVILHSYEEYGENCLKKFNGMFAFALWDSNKKCLMLARDRCGIKPLYYTFNNGKFLFASEIKSLLMCEDVKREMDFEAFHFFINLRYLPGEKTMFKNILKLKPGHYMIISEDGTRFSKKFWSLKYNFKDKGLPYYETALRNLLKEAVERHMISDVPVGIYLSGGIDSSSILAMAAELTDEPIRTFTMGFGEESDELNDAELVARHFNTDHRSIIVKADILKDYPKMIWHMDSPKRNLYTYYLSQFMRNHVKVVLNGLGGDELFGGYTWKYVTANIVLNNRKKFKNKKIKDKIIESAETLFRYQSSLGLIEDDRFMEYLKRLCFIDNNVDLYLMIQTLDEVFSNEYLESKIYPKELVKKFGDPYNLIRKLYDRFFKTNYHMIDQIMMADFSVKAADDFLFVEDGMSMAHSLESRVPFLDNAVVDFSFRMPFKYKIFNVTDAERGAHIGKYVLRKAMKDKLPKRVFEKIKHGFSTDVFRTYTNELKDFASKLLPESYLVKDKLIKKEYITKVLTHFDSRNLLKHYCLIWNLITFEIWYQMYIKEGNIQHPKLNINSYLN